MAKLEEIRNLAENDLWSFARLVNPQREYGEIHEKVFKWLQHSKSSNLLLLLPRSHMKSHCMAVWVSWMITKDPTSTILYLSATTTLAEAQLLEIKGILTSETYSRYWPEMVNEEEGKREKWSTGAIAVDHPLRKAENVRDFTLFAAGLSTNTTGLHCNILVCDDVVVPDNAYTDEGRRKTSAACSQMASILNAGGIIRSCGTRYHAADQYSVWKEQTMPIFDDEGEIIGEEDLWEILEEVVEKDGVFLWPRTARADGKKFGFDRRELARISALYTDRTQFYAQYYNDPNDPESHRLNYDKFQYYDRKFLSLQQGRWHFKEERLNVFASIDFAYSLSKKADSTAIVVVGVDKDYNYYILDIARFKSDKINDYYTEIIELHQKWEFRRLRAETNAAQAVIARDLKLRLKESGSTIIVEENRPTRGDGKKEERIAAVLEPRYENQQIWHFKGGYTPMLEEELILSRPKHDDIKDCLAACVEFAKAPKGYTKNVRTQNKQHLFNSRFGGVNI